MLASLVLVSPFVMTLFTGRHEPGQVTRKWTYQERTKNGTRTVRKIRFKLKPRAPSTRSRHVSVRLAKSEFNGVAVGSTVVALRYRNLFGRDAHVLGSGPSVHWLALLFGSFIALGGFGALWSGMDSQALVRIKLKHSGGGRLPDFPKSSSGST